MHLKIKRKMSIYNDFLYYIIDKINTHFIDKDLIKI
jgi:hypothetical protein